MRRILSARVSYHAMAFLMSRSEGKRGRFVCPDSYLSLVQLLSQDFFLGRRPTEESARGGEGGSANGTCFRQTEVLRAIAWFYQLLVDTKRRRRTLQLLQLRVLGLGLLQDGDVGIGVFQIGRA